MPARPAQAIEIDSEVDFNPAEFAALLEDRGVKRELEADLELEAGLADLQHRTPLSLAMFPADDDDDTVVETGHR